MKTKEFIKRVEELGFKVNRTAAQIDIIGHSFTIVRVYTNRMYAMNAFTFINIEWKNQDKLFDLIVEYAKTPIPDREEKEIKFCLKHRYFKTVNGDKKFFTIDRRYEYPDLQYKAFGYEFIQEFTLKEIGEIKEKYNTDLSDFEMIEVEE